MSLFGIILYARSILCRAVCFEILLDSEFVVFTHICLPNKDYPGNFVIVIYSQLSDEFGVDNAVVYVYIFDE